MGFDGTSLHFYYSGQSNLLWEKKGFGNEENKQEGIKQKVFRFSLVDTYVSDNFKEHFNKVSILFIADKAPEKFLPEYTKNYRGNTGRSESKFYKKMFGVTVVTDFMSMSWLAWQLKFDIHY